MQGFLHTEMRRAEGAVHFELCARVEKHTADA